uniref:ABI family, member 3 (NESH) binding protein b n=1 Tax=Scleropages formosus TaxID=113540 RepID=A0A8C9W0P6_SCLFO
MEIRRQNMKVKINATGDTIVLKFVRPSPDVKLEGYILGYGSSMFSKQFIQLPEDGQPYETEIDAEPKYLIAVQPIPTNDVKKQCRGKVNLEKPLHLIIGTVTPTSVLLSWGTLLKTPYEESVMSDCLEDGHYTVRYRERSRKWNYQTCPTSDTVIDNLKPNTQYEFGVRPNKDERVGTWSKSVVHSTNKEGTVCRSYSLLSGHRISLKYHWSCVLHTHMTNTAVSFSQGSFLFLSYPGRTNNARNVSSHSESMHPTSPRLLPTKPPITTITSVPTRFPSEKQRAQPRAPSPKPTQKSYSPSGKSTLADFTVLVMFSFFLTNKGSLSSCFLTVTRFDIWDNSSVFSSRPASDVDAMGKKRFVAPHVIYKTDKKPDEPCSITSSLSYFSDEETVEQNVTSPPRLPPSNLTVVTVEGCSSFIILDWEKSDNETTEYEVISRTKGPDGEEVSILTTNQTHTAVENLKPESSYEFKVKPKNELGEGPATDPVSFSTESADPRVSENVSGKDAIWTQFPFKSDSYSECNGKQYVKRTWYRKFVGIQLCNSLRYKVYLSDSLNGKFYNIGDQTGHGEDHCQFVDSFLDGRTGSQLLADQLPSRSGYYRAMRQEPVNFGQIGGNSHITYVSWYECGIPIPGKW